MSSTPEEMDSVQIPGANTCRSSRRKNRCGR
jgi:hypothetical protein